MVLHFKMLHCLLNHCSNPFLAPKGKAPNRKESSGILSSSTLTAQHIYQLILSLHKCLIMENSTLMGNKHIETFVNHQVCKKKFLLWHLMQSCPGRPQIQGMVWVALYSLKPFSFQESWTKLPAALFALDRITTLLSSRAARYYTEIHCDECPSQIKTKQQKSRL